jgi:hypothetical protein
MGLVIIIILFVIGLAVWRLMVPEIWQGIKDGLKQQV